ncbi:MAG: hypothetical protein WCD18_22835 [Thermosynechococcaceae cyanobacterium]
MNIKKLSLPLFLVAIAFMCLGDRFLPSPLNTMSLNMRNTVNQFLVGLSPRFMAQKPDAGTEQAVDGLNNPH